MKDNLPVGKIEQLPTVAQHVEMVRSLQGEIPRPESVWVTGIEYRRVRQCKECKHWGRSYLNPSKGICCREDEPGAKITTAHYDVRLVATEFDFGCIQWEGKWDSSRSLTETCKTCKKRTNCKDREVSPYLVTCSEWKEKE